jgi:thiol-disulfide isomerase/thioredoxin
LTATNGSVASATGPFRYSVRYLDLMVTKASWLRRTLALAVLAFGHTGVPLMARAQDSSIVSGSIFGSDGRVPPRADVALSPVRAPARVVKARVGADGRFRVATSDSGPFRLRVAGVGYTGIERAIPSSTPTTITLAITLPGYPVGIAKGPLVGVASEQDAEKARPDAPPAVLLAAGANGRRTGALTAKRDTVFYRVVDITARIFLPPSGATAFRWAEDGEYDGVALATPGQKVELTYDSTLVALGGDPAFSVVGAHPLAPVIAQLDSMLSRPPRRRCMLSAQAPPVDPAAAVLRDSGLSAQLALVRRLLLADAECQVHPALGTAVVGLFTPRSQLWQLDDVMRQRVIQVAARQATGEARFDTPASTRLLRGTFDAAIAAAPDTAARFDLYVAAAETFMPTDTVNAQHYTAEFVREAYAHPRVTPLLRLTGYNRVLQPGRTVPAFRIPTLGNPSVMISDVSLRGRVYLLDVWATWCPDCIVEIPALKALHEQYGKRGLRVISVSIDEEQGTVERYRRVRDPMPWTHSWIGVSPDESGPLAGFEVVWLPTTILVGKDGKILSLAPKLESEEFRTMIERALR